MSVKIDSGKIIDGIHVLLEKGLGLLEKDEYKAVDYVKIRLIRAVSSVINSGVGIIAVEASKERMELMKKRMEQLGYGLSNKEIE